MIGKRRIRSIVFFLLSLGCILAACSTGTTTATPPLVSVYSTFAAEPWLSELYRCAGTSAVLARVDDSSSAELSLRVGEPDVLSGPAYQIDTEEILIVTHRQSPLQNLTLDEARALFSGQGDASVEIWVYAAGEDVQSAFERSVMTGSTVSPAARLAAHPQQMSDTLVNDPHAIGILPRHWKAGDTRDVFSAGTVPVLALTRSEPQGVIRDLIACLQR